MNKQIIPILVRNNTVLNSVETTLQRYELSREPKQATVLVIIKLTKNAVPLRLRCGLGTLYIVWSLVRCRVTRRLTRLQSMCNVLKYRKIL